ncbi:hypothetical protein C5167_035961 [Papaver somniferum]|nr:hypothetical protein C5167_035961 [Papaver somniferum]
MMKQYGDSPKLPPLTGSSSHAVMGIELLQCEILSRVPVKSLMRFKCVCKQWHSLIHKDRSFIDLHFTRSKACNFAVNGAEVLPSEGGVTSVQREIPISGAYFARIVGAINGLICLVECRTRSVCVFNPSTGQSTPWVKSMIKQQHESLCEEIQVIDEDGDYVTHKIEYANASWYYFGYDPATTEHKVIFIWLKMTSNWSGIVGIENICEVMTIGGRQHSNNLSWRRLDDKFSLPPTISPFDFTSSLYANGSIYWLHTGSNAATQPLIVEFNVGTEKFRVISIPKYIIEEIRYPYVSQLIQIDGRLAALAKKICKDTFGERPGTTINNNASMKMCVLYDKDDDIVSSAATTSTSSADGVGDFYWIKETFMMPPFDWDGLDSGSVQAVPGTDLFIISSEGDAGSSFYFYDWRKKRFSKDEQFVIEKRKTSTHDEPFSFVHSLYKESLLPVV